MCSKTPILYYLYRNNSNDMGLIYRITNTVNNKVYIGLTTVSLEKRWNGHMNGARYNTKHPLYNAMRKYGVDNFIMEKIDETNDFEELGLLERKYIKEYDSTNREKGYNITHGGESNQLDGNPRARLTVDEVIKIREIYNECEIGCKKCWEMFKYTGISYDAFEKIYEGKTWKSIMPEIYNEENKIKHRKFYGKKGSENNNALLTDNEVMEIREYYVDHSLRECFEKYGDKFKSKISFRGVIDRSYLHLPYYSKIKKEWINLNKII